MKNILLTSFILFLAVTLAAQNISWGPPEKVRGTLTMIGERDGDVVLHLLESKGFMGLKGKKPTIVIYDQSFKLKKKIDLLEILGEDALIIDLALKDNGYEALSLIKDSDKNIIYKIRFDDKKELSREVFFEAPKDYFYSMNNDPTLLNMQNRKGDISYVIPYSDDRSKIGLFAVDQKRHLLTFTLYDKNEDFKVLTDITYSKINGTNAFEIVNHNIKNDGTVLILIKNYRSTKAKDKVKGLPNYSYKILALKGNDISEYSLPKQAVFTTDAKILIDKSESIYFTSIYEERLKKGAQGIIYSKFNSDGELLFTKKMASKSIKEGKKGLHKFVSLSGALIVDDMIILKSQHKELKVTTSTDASGGSSSSRETYIFKDLIFDGLSLDGDYVWSKRLVRNSQSVAREYLSQSSYYNNNGILTFINTHEKQIADLESDKFKARQVPSKKNHVTMLSIDKDGNHTYEDVSGTVGVTVFGSMVGDQSGSFYFMGITPDYRKLRIGALK